MHAPLMLFYFAEDEQHYELGCTGCKMSPEKARQIVCGSRPRTIDEKQRCKFEKMYGRCLCYYKYALANKELIV